ncbi:thioredoxin [Patescibacteria group bacterium]|nr:thioredoxin [Patescibacteria group bacterium]MCG2702676.1 thioredoxin [Candidatus Parcubacteria bacterium]MBU4264885.1 thioredoxin [Patescibacteria group bacterium]MBU4389756.1 thioredoxin [Patescibacteria group bacterium]MBU4397597.1 thioredoxin [Patescibacteria group bacterium]
MINANDENFKEEVLDHDGKVLVDFWAPWCGPCQMLAPVIEELGKEMEGKIKIVKVNVDESPKTSSQYNISSIPNVILFENSEIKNSLLGFRQKEEYLKLIG